MAVIKDRQRRVVAKMYDGSAAINVRILKMPVGDGLHKVVEEIVELLDYGVGPRDCHRISGMPIAKIREIAVAYGIPNSRIGRPPVHIAPALATPGRHLWLSVFLASLEQNNVGAEGPFLTPGTFVTAIRSAYIACGDHGFEISPPYLFVAVRKLLDKELYFTKCRVCATRHIRSRVPISGRAAVSSQYGSCPMCVSINAMIERSRAKLAGASGSTSRARKRTSQPVTTSDQTLPRTLPANACGCGRSESGFDKLFDHY